MNHTAFNSNTAIDCLYPFSVKRLSLKRFVQRLEMEEIVGKELAADTPLQTDDCASLLVKWVNIKKENDADTLLEMFPRIKPGITHAIIKILYFTDYFAIKNCRMTKQMTTI